MSALTMTQDYGSLATKSTEAAVATGRMSGAAALNARDISAICSFLSLPTPTPDVSFSDVIQMSGLTEEDVYVRLERSTNINVMIAAAALRKGVTRLKNDTRLNPAKLPKNTAPKTDRSSAPRTPRTEIDDIRGDAVIEAIAACPSAEGSKRAERYALYVVGSTVTQLLAKGVRAKDLRRHIADGSITLRQA